jgi:hypothetical protein
LPDVFFLWRPLKLLLKLVLVFLVGFVALVAWGNFWPAPHRLPTVPCPQHDGFRCVRVSGRVLYSTWFGRGRRAHAIIMSRSSVTLPGITSLELPALARQPRGFGLGDWIAATGQRAKGSHGESDIHVWAFTNGSETISCADPGVAADCHRHRR